MTALSLRGLNKSFGTVDVIKDVNLDVEQGEFTVFVGPSGCGKSTLLRLIAGLEDATSGEVYIDDHLVNMTPPAKRGIAMVFQSYALYPHLTVRGNMTLALKQEGLSRRVIDERVDEAARMLDLASYLDRRPAALSGGQRQRVAIGRAVVRQPKLFLFDEPLSNLDAALRMNTRLEISTLHRSLQATIIYVTHDQTEAMTLADKIVVLRDGRVEQIGTPLELYNQPANQFVAGFLGSPAMNFFPAVQLGSEHGTTAGIRPEHLRVDPDGPLQGKVIHVEKLGGDTNIVVNLSDGPNITVRLFGQHAHAANDDIKIGFDRSDMLVFDAAGNTITSAA